ncbi:MmcQ/YjbR family DNA-binding protein [Edaphobacter flagellatus]|uniref:MmcQ/YjbR family DNA-binding protein n=1 Tax=Edaphobacter flagellatus TaxID=1933044 RepID=UPI0021B30E7E|nr:MmcQ/YjbR family DNA-binding protein [Edaphobacter flagellatus]
MKPSDFRRIALSLDGTEESSHMGAADFRVGGHIFATLASEKQGYGNLMLSPELQQAFITDQPDIFLPIAGGWGRMGMTHIRLTLATEDILTGALRAAYNLRLEKNQRTAKSRKSSRKSSSRP